jgi:hypothetical protein
LSIRSGPVALMLVWLLRKRKVWNSSWFVIMGFHCWRFYVSVVLVFGKV